MKPLASNEWSFRDGAQAPGPESITTAGAYGFRARGLKPAPRKDGSNSRGQELADCRRRPGSRTVLQARLGMMLPYKRFLLQAQAFSSQRSRIAAPYLRLYRVNPSKFSGLRSAPGEEFHPTAGHPDRHGGRLRAGMELGSLPPLTPEATDNRRPRPVVVARHRAIHGAIHGAIRGIWLAAAAAGTSMRSRVEPPGRGKRGRNRSSAPDAVGENTHLIKIFVT
jgi:hypothetical protein